MKRLVGWMLQNKKPARKVGEECIKGCWLGQSIFSSSSPCNLLGLSCFSDLVLVHGLLSFLSPGHTQSFESLVLLPSLFLPLLLSLLSDRPPVGNSLTLSLFIFFPSNAESGIHSFLLPTMSSPGALGMTFKCVRILQPICLVPVIGITANFVGEIMSSTQPIPQVLVGTLSVVCTLLIPLLEFGGCTDRKQACIALLYTAITFILYLDSMLPFLFAAIVDGLILIAFIVVAVVIGQPLTYLNCQAIGSPSAAGNMYDFTSALGMDPSQSGTVVNFNTWITSSKKSCLEMKSVWGLSISIRSGVHFSCF